MMTNTRHVVLYIAMSLDGYIAKPNDDLSFLSIVEKEGEDYGYADFASTVDTVIMGRKTYDWITERVPFPHADKVAYIITRTERPPVGSTMFYTGDLSALIHGLRSTPGKNIFCDGGADVANELLRGGLIDELIISVIPVLVGSGTRLFQNGIPEHNLTLVGSVQYDTGLVQLRYRIQDEASS